MFLRTFCARVALRDATRQRWDNSYIASVTFALKNYGIFHVKKLKLTSCLAYNIPVTPQGKGWAGIWSTGFPSGNSCRGDQFLQYLGVWDELLGEFGNGRRNKSC
jgi:hypothetical protein